MSITMKSPNNFGNYSISDDGLTVNGGSRVFYVESSEVLNKTLYFECVLNGMSFGSHLIGFTIGDHEIYNILNYHYIRGSSVVFAIDTYGRIMGIIFYYENGPYKEYNFPYIDFTSTDVVSFGVNKEYADFYKNGVLVYEAPTVDAFKSDFDNKNIYAFETCQWSTVSSSITYRFEDFTYPELANKYNIIIDYYRLMDDKKDLYQIVD